MTLDSFNSYTVKPILSSHSKIDKTKVIKTDGSLMEVESIAECSLGAFCITFDLHLAIIGLENQYLVLFEWPLKTGFTVSLHSCPKAFCGSIVYAVHLFNNFSMQSRRSNAVNLRGN